MAVAIGFLLGLLGSIPVAGPIGVLVITRGLAGRFRSALAIAWGAAIAEGGYAALALWGFGALVAHHEWVEPLTRGVGTCVLAILALLLLRVDAGPPSRPQRDGEAPFASFALGFGVAAANPTLIVSWAAAVTAIHATGLLSFDQAAAGLFAAGTMLGIVSWFSGLVYAMWRLREHFHPERLVRIQHAAGYLVLALAGVFLVRFVAYFV